MDIKNKKTVYEVKLMVSTFREVTRSLNALPRSVLGGSLFLNFLGTVTLPFILVGDIHVSFIATTNLY